MNAQVNARPGPQDDREPRSGTQSPWNTYRRLLKNAQRHWLVLLVSVLAMGVVGVSQAGFAAMMKPLLDDSFMDKQQAVAAWLPIAIVGLFLARGIAGFCSSYGMNYVGRHVILDLRRDLFDQLLRFRAACFDHVPGAQLISKMTYNIEQVAQASTSAITIVVRDSITASSLIGVMLWQSTLLTATFAVVAPFIALVVRTVSRRFRAISTRIQNSMGDVTELTSRIVEGHKVVKTFSGEEYERQLFTHANEKNRRLYLKLVSTNALSSAIVEMAGAVALAAIIVIATRPGTVDAISPGSFVAFLSAMMLLFPAIKRLSNVNATIQRGIAAAQTVFELLDQQPERDNGTVRIRRAQGRIEFRHVDVDYQQGQGLVLTDVNFVALPGTVTAIVGRSGSGKSSLVSLLPRFFEPEHGDVLLDGIPLYDFHLSDLRAQIAWVGQEVVLFNDTVRNNIAYGKLADATLPAIEQAARDACAWDFIQQLPKGLETVVGDKGVLLSGGQRQRIMIARALLKDAPVLILDEATSALDSESEQAIHEALDTLMQHRTTLVIAHRLSTVEKADQVIVLDNGHIVEQGRHDRLMALNGHYAKLHQFQGQG